jgi:nudix-type nucleoside diphosphatase (YffH/AdpP family)
MQKLVEILARKQVFKQAIFRIEEATLRYMKYAGVMSEPIVRLNLDRGDSVAILMHNIDQDTVVLTEQFKYPTYDPAGKRGDGWIIELPAGMVDEGESPEDAVRREVIEETGYALESVRHISTFYVSPGGTSERIILYYAGVRATDRTDQGGGVASEGEDIRVLSVRVGEALQMIDDGRIADAKTIVALFWLQMNRPV